MAGAPPLANPRMSPVAPSAACKHDTYLSANPFSLPFTPFLRLGLSGAGPTRHSLLSLLSTSPTGTSAPGSHGLVSSMAGRFGSGLPPNGFASGSTVMLDGGVVRGCTAALGFCTSLVIPTTTCRTRFENCPVGGCGGRQLL